eukprot:Gb_15125 [translate_table: standard]
MKGVKAQDKLLKTLGDFTSRENWDEFFKLRSAEPFEWYGDWSSLAEPLALQCGLIPSEESPLDILVPGCGNSELSEKLYDAGFKRITNIDFSKVLIGDMLRKHLRSRPGMLWRVMDMTNMQFSDGSFDIVLDKGGLDALMEPELGPKLGAQFLCEVKRVLRTGGKYICVSLVQTHVIELLFSKFRFGWQVNVHAIPNPGSVSNYHPFLVVATKEDLSTFLSVTTSFDPTMLIHNKLQVRGLSEAITKENKLRNQHATGEDILYSMEELEIGVKGDMKQLIPGRRASIILGNHGISRFDYRAVVMDAYEAFGPFIYFCGVFLIPKTRAHEWLFSSEEGQWQVVESAKTGRLIMVFLDTKHDSASMEDIQKDLSPLVQGLAPTQCDNGFQIPFMMASDGVAKRTIVQEVESPLTGKIIVEDVIFSEKNTDKLNLSSENEIFRRLIFERNPGLVQSEALLRRLECPNKGVGKTRASETGRRSKSGKKKSHAENESGLSVMQGPKNNLKVDHSYLASLYHGGMIAGFGLIISELERWAFSEKLVRTVIIGLGAGLLPMFLHEHMPFLKIEAVELDPVVADLARQNFGFIDDERMKLHIGDGVQIVKEKANVSKSSGVDDHFQANPICSEKTLSADTLTSSTGKNKFHMETDDSKGVHVLIVDADSNDLSTGLTCPHFNFVEESFLETAKESLVAGGILILNLVSRSTSVHEMVISRMEAVFEQLFSLEIEEDVNKILFALPQKGSINKDGIFEMVTRLEKLLTNFTTSANSLDIKESARKMKCLK